jgi:HSA
MDPQDLQNPNHLSDPDSVLTEGEDSAFARPGQSTGGVETDSLVHARQKSAGEAVAEGSDHAQEDTNVATRSQDAIVKEESQNARDNLQTQSQPQPQPVAKAESKITKAASTVSSTEDERTIRIRRALEYRKDLLDRIKRGRSAAQSSLDAFYQKSPGLKGESSGQEIKGFQNMTKEANAIARKQNRIDFDSEKRTVSLRRGSSVGKRMNSAIASLVPSSAAAAAATMAAQSAEEMSISTTSAANASSTLYTHRPLPKSNAAPLSRAVSLATGLTALTIPNSMQSAAAISSANKKVASPVNTHNPSVPAATRAPSIKSNKAANPLSRTMSTASGLTQSALSLPAQPAASMPAPRVVQPPVIFPEAIALRERRNALQDKLFAILKDRPEYAQSQQQSRKSGQIKRESPKLEKGRILDAPELCARLPNRRQTHWDYLLEEMRWMAADFHEERKWKESTKSHLAEEVMKKQVSKMTTVVSKNVDSQVNSMSNHAAASSGDEKTAEPSTPLLKPAITDKKEESGSTYTDPSDVDVSAARSVSRRLVSELQRGTTLVPLRKVPGAATHTDSKKDDSENANKVEETPAIPDSELQPEAQDSNGSTNASNDVETKQDAAESMAVDDAVAIDDADAQAKLAKETKAARFAEINERLQDLLEKADSSGPKSMRNSAKASAKSSLESKLTFEQSSTVHRVEDCWTRLGSGAVLVGPHASGKTFSVCALLWTHRHAGVHLLMCAQASMVSGQMMVG